MLLPSKSRNYRLIITVFAGLSLLVASWSLLPKIIWTSGFRNIQLLSAWSGQINEHVSLPTSTYSQPVVNPNECSQKLGATFLQATSNTSVSYCNNASSSSLSCFRTRASSERTDSFCLGTPALFDKEDKKFKIGCTLSDLTGAQVAAGVPSLAQFPSYWYNTGPREILDRHVKMEAAEIVPTQDTSLPKEYNILVRREGPVDNLFHHFMQMFSIFMTLDVFQMTLDPLTDDPLFAAEAVKSTRVIILDDHEEGPFYDQWTAFATKPVMRIQDLLSNASSTPVNIVLPLPGSANPLWQDGWEPKDCGNSTLLQLFAQRMLGFYDVSTKPEHPNRQLVLTFIDRTEKRSLINKEAYIEGLKFLYPDVHINLINFASLSFAEQVRTVRNTDILMGVHGAGLTHGIFLPDSSTMIEIMPHDFNPKTFRNIAKIMGHHYFTDHGVEDVNHPTSKGWQFDDVYIEQSRFNTLVNDAIKVMSHRGSKESR